MRLERDSRLGRERLDGQADDQSLVTILARPAARLVREGGHESLQRPDQVKPLYAVVSEKAYKLRFHSSLRKKNIDAAVRVCHDKDTTIPDARARNAKR